MRTEGLTAAERAQYDRAFGCLTDVVTGLREDGADVDR
jgi:hypothetical protein